MTLGWGVLGIAMLAGIAVVAVAWSLGPGLFGGAATEEQQTYQATVRLPAACDDQGARENVQVMVNGEQRDVTLSACGHTEGENVQVVLVPEPKSGEAEVRLVDTAHGTSDARRPVGLFLMALSCAAGAGYAFLVARGGRLVPARA